jgi:uncharacterized protein (TIGR02996 family)
MSDREALLAAIRAAPDDDAPRLVFADWLDEHGESGFAQFIRLEIERDRLPADDLQRERLLTLKLRQAFPGRVDDLDISSSTRRGFHATIQAGLLGLRAGLDRLGPYAPRVSVLISGGRAAERAATAEAMAGAPDVMADAFREIFASPWVRHWYALDLQDLLLPQGWVRWMTGPGNLTGLEELAISGGLDDDGVRVLADADLPRLTGLLIHEVLARGDPELLTSDAAFALAESPLLARLDTLNIVGRWVDDNGLRALAASPRLAGLRLLVVCPWRDSWTGLRALIESPHLSGLTSLDISWQELGPGLAELLARPDVLPGLTRLAIAFPDRAELEALARRFGDGLIVEEEETAGEGEEG